MHLSREHGREADRWPVAAVSQQYVVVAVDCHVRANILRAMKVEFFKLYNVEEEKGVRCRYESGKEKKLMPTQKENV